MPSNPFDTPDAPDMGEITQQQQQTSNEALAQGRFTQAYGQNLDRSRMGLVMPAIQNQQYIADQFANNGQQQQTVYDSTYRPIENLQVLDAIGGSWLSPEQRARILTNIGAQQRVSLRDSYLDERRTIQNQGSEAGQIAANAASAARNNTATRDAAARAAGQTGGVSQPAPGGIAPLTTAPPAPPAPGQFSAPVKPGAAPAGGMVGPVAGGLPVPAKPAAKPASVAPGTVNSNRMSDARNDFLTDTGQVNRNTQTAIMMANAQDAAQAAAEARARGDVQQAEDRNAASIAMNAGRMGVDPSRALAVQGAMSPDMAAAAVNAGNQARFGVRDRQTAALAGAVGTGRQINATAAGDYGAAMAGNNAVANNVNSTINSSIQAQNAGLPWYNAASGALNSQANTMNQQYQNQLSSFNSNPFWDIAGTAAGVWAGAQLASSPDVKMHSERMDRPDVLEAVKEMDTDSWEYKPGLGLPPGRHIGPYADQMQRLGMSDGKTVNIADTAGLALASVKQLAKDIDEIKELMGRGSAGLRRAA